LALNQSIGNHLTNWRHIQLKMMVEPTHHPRHHQRRSSVRRVAGTANLSDLPAAEATIRYGPEWRRHIRNAAEPE